MIGRRIGHIDMEADQDDRGYGGWFLRKTMEERRIQPCHTPGKMSVAVYERRASGTGSTY